VVFAARWALRVLCLPVLTGVETPIHIDPEHNLLLQIRGSKTVSLNDPSRQPLVSEAQVRAFYRDEVGFTLGPEESWPAHLEMHELSPGDGLFIPHVAPHAVTNGHAPCISFSFTFRVGTHGDRKASCRAKAFGFWARPEWPHRSRESASSRRERNGLEAGREATTRSRRGQAAGPDAAGLESVGRK